MVLSFSLFLSLMQVCALVFLWISLWTWLTLFPSCSLFSYSNDYWLCSFAYSLFVSTIFASFFPFLLLYFTRSQRGERNASGNVKWNLSKWNRVTRRLSLILSFSFYFFRVLCRHLIKRRHKSLQPVFAQLQLKLLVQFLTLMNIRVVLSFLVYPLSPCTLCSSSIDYIAMVKGYTESKRGNVKCEFLNSKCVM